MNHIRNVSIGLKFRTSQLYGLAPLRLFVTLTYHIASWYFTPIEVPYQLRRSKLVSAITNDSCTQYELHHSTVLLLRIESLLLNLHSTLLRHGVSTLSCYVQFLTSCNVRTAFTSSTPTKSNISLLPTPVHRRDISQIADRYTVNNNSSVDHVGSDLRIAIHRIRMYKEFGVKIGSPSISHPI